jgi:hypothetical protein
LAEGTVQVIKLSSITSLDFLSAKLSSSKLNPGDSLIATFQFKNTGNTPGVVYPDLFILGPTINDNRKVFNIATISTSLQPNHSGTSTIIWTVPNDLEPGNYRFVAQVLNNYPDASDVKSYGEEKQGFILVNGGSFIQVEEGLNSNKVINIHVIESELPKLKQTIGGNTISLHNLVLVLSASGVIINVDEAFLSSNDAILRPLGTGGSRSVTIPPSGDFDVTLLQEFNQDYGRIYSGVNFSGLENAVSGELLDVIIGALPTDYGSRVNEVYKLLKFAGSGDIRYAMKWIQGIVIHEIFGDWAYPAKILLLMLTELNNQLYIDPPYTEMQGESYYPINLLDPVKLDLTTSQKAINLGVEYTISVKLTDSRGIPIDGAKIGYYVFEVFNGKGLLVGQGNGKYSTTLNVPSVPVATLKIRAFEKDKLAGFLTSIITSPSSGVSTMNVAGSVNISKDASTGTNTVYTQVSTLTSDVSIAASTDSTKITVNVSSEKTLGKTIVINIDQSLVGAGNIDQLIVTLDGNVVPLASDLADVLNIVAAPKYLVFAGSNGIQVMLSIPHFSAHIIEVSGRALNLSGNPIGVPPSLDIRTITGNGLSVSINGLTEAKTSGATVTKIHVSWGDGAEGDITFPTQHAYGKSGTYTISFTVYQSDGLSIVKSQSVSVTEPGLSIPAYPMASIIVGVGLAVVCVFLMRAMMYEEYIEAALRSNHARREGRGGTAPHDDTRGRILRRPAGEV